MGDPVSSAINLERSLNKLLENFGRFGVELGLERIQRLLAALGNPHHQTAILHVAGSNGKGSVCAYLQSVLMAAGYRVGGYTSPHLVSWCERITINQRQIAPQQLLRTLEHVIAAIDPSKPSPTQFEVFTAAMWVYFAQQQVDLAVIEVGLGGRLDATNVCEMPLVTVITSLSREHWQRLGPTLADIAREKAGILKLGRPAVIGPLPAEAERVVRSRLQDLACPSLWPQPAAEVGNMCLEYRGATALDSSQTLVSAEYSPIRYPKALLGSHQRVNSALAIASVLQLRTQGWAISDEAIVQGLGETRWPGRLEWLRWMDKTLLLDGAHNPAAAKVLRDYVDGILGKGKRERKKRAGDREQETGMKPRSLPLTPYPLPLHPSPSTTWIMGMLSTKDHADVFQALLRPGDQLHLVPVPGHLSAEPAELRDIAISTCPDLASCQVHADLLAGLQAAEGELKVLCGSLYLIGHFLAEQGACIKRLSAHVEEDAGKGGGRGKG